MAQAKKAQEPAQSAETTDAPPIGVKGPTKSSAVLTLLQREKGATLDEIVEATGWQPCSPSAPMAQI